MEFRSVVRSGRANKWPDLSLYSLKQIFSNSLFFLSFLNNWTVINLPIAPSFSSPSFSLRRDSLLVFQTSFSDIFRGLKKTRELE